MKIRRVTIKNFRGIRELNWNLPVGNIFCLIGKGDSSKSTILNAIKYAFYPQWNLSLNDSDFYQCNTDEPIFVEVTIGDLIEEFYSENKYGHYLRGWNNFTTTLSDETDDDLEDVLTIRLIIEKDLEPKWFVVCERNPDGVVFKQADRVKVSVGLIGEFSDRQLSWAAGTALARLTESQSLNELLANASRTARNSLDVDRAVSLKNFDDAAQVSQTVAKHLGVPIANGYKAHLDLNSINLKVGGLALHDGDIPLRQLGLGSRRMLLCGIQKKGLEVGHITLFDEIELGLEPHRISRLIKNIREDVTGQYFLTTHSPTVLRELNVNELYIVHNINGIVQVIATSDKGLEQYNVQGKLRSSADAFLAKKVIVCEGATEVGFLRGLDDYRLNNGNDPFSFHGVALLDANGGGKVKNLAKAFKSMCFDVSIFADSDAEDQLSQKDIKELEILGVGIHVWSENLSIEGRAMQDLPWNIVIESVRLVRDEFSVSVRDQIHSIFTEEILDHNPEKWIDSQNLRSAIGTIAKRNNWFKNISKGDLWFKVITPAFDDCNFLKSDMAVKLNNLWIWAENVR
jgi:putative ATP-dependent endonuclease of OLD family